jgi:hypothetical protein
MAERPRRVDLRLTIPAEPAFRPMAGEVAAKFAAYAGASADAAAKLAASTDAAAAQLAGPGTELALDFDAHDDEVTVTVHAGGRSLHISCASTTR